MGEVRAARPSTSRTIYILDCNGYVVGWPSRAGMVTTAQARQRHVSTFYPTEACDAGEPERDLRFAAAGGLEMTGWRIREDGTRFWAHVLMTAVEDNSRHALGFVLVLREESEESQASRVHPISLPMKFDRRRR